MTVALTLMQAMPHQQIFIHTYEALRFPLLQASTTYRAKYLESQAAEAEQETLLETLSAEEGQQRHGSESATAAAVLLCIGNASARAGYQTVPQVRDASLLYKW